MKNLQIILLFIIQSNFVFGQNLNFKDYRTNDEEVFSMLDSNYVNYFLKELRIKCLTETKYYYDTLGNIKDSAIANVYVFDSIGRIIEKRFDFRFKSTKYRLIKYTYLDNGTVTKNYVDPFGPDSVLDGFYVSDRLPMYCEYRNNSYQIETINIKTELDGVTYTMKYHYDQNLFMKNFNYNEYLISGLDFLEGDKLQYRHKISYEK